MSSSQTPTAGPREGAKWIFIAEGKTLTAGGNHCRARMKGRTIAHRFPPPPAGIRSGHELGASAPLAKTFLGILFNKFVRVNSLRSRRAMRASSSFTSQLNPQSLQRLRECMSSLSKSALSPMALKRNGRTERKRLKPNLSLSTSMPFNTPNGKKSATLAYKNRFSSPSYSFVTPRS